MPRPNVDSAVIRLERFKTPPVDVKNEHLMFKIIRASFNQRRKTMLNSVGNSGIGITKEALTNALETMGLPLTIRGEALTLVLNNMIPISSRIFATLVGFFTAKFS